MAKRYSGEEAAAMIVDGDLDESLSSVDDDGMSDDSVNLEDYEESSSSSCNEEVVLPNTGNKGKTKTRGGMTRKMLRTRGGCNSAAGSSKGDTGMDFVVNGNSPLNTPLSSTPMSVDLGQAKPSKKFKDFVLGIGKRKKISNNSQNSNMSSSPTTSDLNHSVNDDSDGWSKTPYVPPVFRFNVVHGMTSSGLLALDQIDPVSLFNLLADESFFEMMVNETNLFAEQRLADMSMTRRKYSRLNKWHPMDIIEMKRFVGILYLMGIHLLPCLKDYWSNDVLYKTFIFQKLMSRNRFQNILKFWHFSDNENATTSRLYKVEPMIQCSNEKMSTIYVPNEHLPLDESVVLWRGRLIFRQYIKNKRHKYGIKFFELCESNGIILRISIYSGEGYEDANNLGQTGAIVLHLMDDFLDKGYSVYTDNYYNSVPLTEYLANRSTYITGTVRKDRVGLPTHVIKKKLKKVNLNGVAKSQR